MRRLTLSLFAVLALIAVAAGTALAGGMAIVVPDEPTDGPTAGEPFDVGFTLLQHGVTPVDDGIVEVTLTSPGGQELVTRAEGQGQGHWLATVTLPEAGDWTWAVQMPAGLEIVQPSGPHAITVTAGPQPLDAPVLAGGMVLGFLVLLALLVVAARASDPARRAAAAPVRIARQA